MRVPACAAAPATAPSDHPPAAQGARYSNGGAYPPDLSLITKARHDGTNYGMLRAARALLWNARSLDPRSLLAAAGLPRAAGGRVRARGAPRVARSRKPQWAALTRGAALSKGLHYNPYFPGGAIAMPKMLVDGGVEYDDGTPATESQMAKDVCTFLSWAAEPEHDERKLMGAKFMFVLSLVLFQAAYFKVRFAPSP